MVELAATRLIALHKNKGKSVAACLKSRTDYVQNPDKTEHGELISSYECSPLTVDMLNQANGDRQILAKQLNISPHQLSYVTHSGEGEGLLFFGNVILPFVDHFPKDLELYRILTTKLNEISEGAQK